MNKSSFFAGQPIFSQILSLIPRHVITAAARKHRADRYYKKFDTYHHLVTMLFSIYNNCSSLREIITGIIAWALRINHIGLTYFPPRSTIADANVRRNAEVFEDIYLSLLDQYGHFLPDSRSGKRLDSRTFIVDSTVITLFSEVMRGTGRIDQHGRRKGGIKVNTVVRSDQDVPCVIGFSEAKSNDVKFLQARSFPRHSIVIFDKAYLDYATYNRFTREGVTWVTRLKKNAWYLVIEEREVSEKQKQQGITTDTEIMIGNPYHKDANKSRARLVCYTDPYTGDEYEFITNNFRMAPITIANLYKKRWQIELLFKRLKQNYQLKYFLGETENAIKIQVWCILIADLLLKVIKKQTKCRSSFSNLVSIVRLNSMAYMDLRKFLTTSESELIRQIKNRDQLDKIPSLFIT